jgi:hypothetical protein
MKRAEMRHGSCGERCMSARWRGVAAALVMAMAILEARPIRAESGGQEESAPLEKLRMQARAYEHGEGVKKSVAQALELYCKAARDGDAEAQFSIGWIYANGRGVSRDDGLAAYFFTLAAEQGHQQATNMIRYVGERSVEMPACLRPDPPAAPPQHPVQHSAKLDLEPEEFVPATASQKKALQLVNELAPKYGVMPRLALAVIRAESNFDTAARSPKNAQGLMQLIPETSARFNVAKPFDPAQNVRGGLAYLRWLLAYFEGDVSLVAAAYNAGEGTVNRYRGVPPYLETRTYVKRIVEFFGRDVHPFDAAVTEPSPDLPRIRRTSSLSEAGAASAVSWRKPRVP